MAKSRPQTGVSAVSSPWPQAHGPRLHIESLKVTIPGNGEQDGHRFIAELRSQLAERSAALFGHAFDGNSHLGGVR
ncbi:MAG TPA: hypothetical protein VIV60_14740, partial [Polyangiaceae bacterium]